MHSQDASMTLEQQGEKADIGDGWPMKASCQRASGEEGGKGGSEKSAFLLESRPDGESGLAGEAVQRGTKGQGPIEQERAVLTGVGPSPRRPPHTCHVPI